MKTGIQVRNSNLTDELREQVEHQLAIARWLFPEHIHGVVAVLSDANGPNGGIDKRCSLASGRKNRSASGCRVSS